ncbi:uncharacterized protein LOC120370226 [Mauremys reevesii]|uniref:uncharacterized protein LOC120370226 n=1 Tax=Mauremys reevesii TaxID=260615 RepID=UPI00193EF257|nr:uncharacterized protein LOC120370226 [Mauremys reevesii]
MNENIHCPLSSAEYNEPHTSGLQLAMLACNNGSEQPAEPTNPSNEKASLLNSAEPSKAKERRSPANDSTGHGAEHLEMAPDLWKQSEMQRNRVQQTQSEGDSSSVNGLVLMNGLHTEFEPRKERDFDVKEVTETQGSTAPRRSDADLEERDSPSKELYSKLLSGVHLQTFLDSPEVLSAGDSEEQLSFRLVTLLVEDLEMVTFE